MKNRRGFVLLTVLSLAFILLAIVTALCKDAFFQMNKSVVFNSKNEAQMIAECGANKAIFFLEKKNGITSPAEWAGEMDSKTVNNGTFDVRLWNNLSSSTSKNVSEINDGSYETVPARSILIESAGKTVNGYKKTVKTILTYQLIPQVINSGGSISMSGDNNMSVILDSLKGFLPKVHSNDAGNSSFYNMFFSGTSGTDSIYVNDNIVLNANKGVFSTVSTNLASNYKSKIEASGGKVQEGQLKKNYNVDIPAIFSNIPSGTYEFGKELENINSGSTLNDYLGKLKLANNIFVQLLTGSKTEDYAVFDSDIDIDKIDSVENFKFTGTYRGKGDGTLWASNSIDIKYKDGTSASNQPIWLSIGDDPNKIPQGLKWDSVNNKLTIEENNKFLSKDNNYCIGDLKLEDMSLEIESNVELYISKKLRIENVDITCDDNVKIVSGGDVILKNSTFRIGNENPSNPHETEKVSIMTGGDFIAIMKNNPSGNKNYIKGSIYTAGGVIIDGNQCSLEIEGVLLSKGDVLLNNYLLNGSGGNNFSCSFIYNPYMAGQFLQEKVNENDLQLQPLFWEVR
jgi:hypothetical protein